MLDEEVIAYFLAVVVFAASVISIAVVVTVLFFATYIAVAALTRHRIRGRGTCKVPEDCQTKRVERLERRNDCPHLGLATLAIGLLDQAKV